MSESGSGLRDDRLGALLDEYQARRRAGEAVEIDAFAAEHPDLADELRELVPTIDALHASSVAAPENGVLPDFEQLGPYKLLREIGRGGMGIVFEAEDEQLGRRVALKLLPPQFQLAPAFLERFKVEAKAAATLGHENIVPVYGAGEDRGVHYCAMQFIDGYPLDQLIQRVKGWRSAVTDESVLEPTLADLADSDGVSPLPAESSNGSPGARTKRMLYFRSAARLMIDVCDAIAHAHTAGVLHRDLKPSNLIVDRSGKVWVSDFGLAKVEGAGNLTQTGEMLGTLRYLAPERLQEGGGSSTASGDIYAIGLILYELLTLEPAFGAVDRAALVKQVGDGRARRPRRIDAAIPPDLETIALKALSPLPDARYSSAAAIADDLRAFLAARPIAARPPKLGYLLRLAVQRNRVAAVAAAVALLVVIGASIAYVIALNRTVKVAEDAKTTAERERDEARFRSYAAEIAAASTAMERGDSVTARERLTRAPAEHRSWEWHYLSRAIDTSVRTFEIERGRESAYGYSRRVHVRYHPDGKRVLATAGGRVHLWDAESGELLAKAQHRKRLGWAKFQWGPQGRWFAANSKDENQIQVWSVEPLEIVRRIPAVARAIAVSPDGKSIAGIVLGRLTLYDVETGEAKRNWSLGDRGYSAGLAFTPDGSHLVAGAGPAIHVLGVEDGSNREIPVATERQVGNLALSPDGSRAAVDLGGGRIAVVELTSGRVRHVLRGPLGSHDLAFHPDGRQLAAAGSGGVYLWQLTERVLRPRLLRGHGHRVRSVSFRPDGSALVTGADDFLVKLWEPARIPPARHWAHYAPVARIAWDPQHDRIATWSGDYTVRMWDPTTLVQLAARPVLAGYSLAFTPEGKLLTRTRGGGLVVRDPDSFEVERELPAPPPGSRDTIFSPSGALVAVWSHTRGAHLSVHEWPSWRTRWSKIANPEKKRCRLAFSRDERWIAYSVGSRVNLVDAETGAMHALGRHDEDVTGVAFFDRGRRLASVGLDGAMIIWDVANRHRLRALDLDAALQSLDATPDGTRLVTGSRRGRVMLWDAARLEPVLTVQPFGFEQWARAFFSPDGDRLAICDRGGRMVILDASDRRDRDGVPEPTSEPFDRDDIVEHAWQLAVTPGLEARAYRVAEIRLGRISRPGNYVGPTIVVRLLRYRMGKHSGQKPSPERTLASPLASDQPTFEQTRRALRALQRAAWKQPKLARKWLGWLREHIAEHGSHLPAAFVAEVEAMVSTGKPPPKR